MQIVIADTGPVNYLLLIGAPSWLEVRTSLKEFSSPELAALGAGERSAIELATELGADVLLMDDRRGVSAAIHLGTAVTGTMGLLARAAKRDLIDLADAFVRLRRTNFRYRRDIMDALLVEAAGRSPTPGE